MNTNEVKNPSLRVCISEVCDKKCFYCRPSGEGRVSVKRSERLTDDDFIYLIGAIVKAGVSIVRFTGGEPMLNRDVYNIINALKRMPELKDISMVTRSANLKKEAKLLKEAGLDSVTVSIDSLKKDKSKWITKIDILDKIIEGTYACKEVGLPIKINTVMMKGVNDDEIEAFIRFAGELGPASWKLLDYMVLPGQFEDNPDNGYFLNLNKILPKLCQFGGKQEGAGYSTQVGGLGTPMPTFLMPNGVVVYLKDSTLGSHYGDVCRTCSLYPCQDAIMALRLTGDGKLQRCLYREDNFVNLKPYMYKDERRLNELINEVLDTFRFAGFHPKVWRQTQ